MSWISYLIAFMFFMHGLAHLSGFFASWTRSDAGYSDRPWMISKNVTLRSPTGRLFGLLWLVAAAALVSTSFGLAFGNNWWPTTAVLGSVTSLFVILPWLRTVPPGAWIGGVFDLLTLLALVLPWNTKIIGFFR